MITRHYLLVISLLHLKDISCQQNDFNNPNGGQSQGIIQKSLNQIASNQGLPINLQQILNSRQSNTQQPQNLQSGNIALVDNNQNFQGSFQPSCGKSSKGYHQQLVVQKPQVLIDLPNFNDYQYAVDNGNHPNFVVGDVQLFQQQNPGISAHSFQSAPIASSPQTVVNFQPPLHSFIESSSGPYPQNQQVVISGVPSYVIESSQPNFVKSPQFANTATINDPSYSFYPGPQPNLQILEFSQPESPNQITVTRYVQPQSSVISSTNQQQMIGNNQIGSSQISYPAVLQFGSNSASVPSNRGTKSSSLKALLPLILNVLKDRDNCDCCGCDKNNNKTPQGGEINGKDKRNGFKSNKKVSDNFLDFDDRYDNDYRGSGKKQRRNKNVKYDDSYEDYDNDENFN